MTTAPSSARAASPVTMRCSRRVGWITTQKISATTISPPMNPCHPVIRPFDVNQLFAFLKKEPPTPMPMIRPLIWRFWIVSRTSKATMARDANTSVNDSSQPMNGPALGMKRLVNT